MRSVVAAAVAAAFVLTGAIGVAADETYAVTGNDTVRVGSQATQTHIDLHGVETLSVADRGSRRIFRSHVEYRRNGAAAVGEYEFTVLPSGEGKGSADRDPDEMTVLHQPFLVELDRATRMAVAQMRTAVPMAFDAPVGDSTVSGTLERIDGAPDELAIGFQASGPFAGDVPEQPGQPVAGTITMRGSARYRADDGSLIDLHVRLSIAGSFGSDRRRLLIEHDRRFVAADAVPERAANR